MSNPTITGRHKFDHLVGGYPQYQSPEQTSLDIRYGPVGQVLGTLIVAMDEWSVAFGVSKVLREALADYWVTPDTEDAPRPRALVLDLEQVMASGANSATNRVWGAVIRQSRDTDLPIVIRSSRMDTAIISPGVKERLEARMLRGQ